MSVRLRRDGDRLCYSFDDEQVWIEPWGRDSLRVRATKCARMPEEDWALMKPQERDDEVLSILVDDRGASITNGNITAQVTPFGRITIRNSRGELLLSEYVRNWSDVKADHASALGIEGRELRPIPGGDYRLTMRLESLADDERIYGMGQYQQPHLNLKGTELELAQRNSQASVPFAVSSLGYGFLWNNPAVGRVTFGRNITIWQAEATRGLDYWITAGDTPAAIVEAYTSVTGRVPMMPDFAMGFWQCKLRYHTQEELLEVAREYKRRELPISVIVCDYFHWPVQGSWRFDPECWPDPEAMLAELEEMGIELMVSVWPTVDYRSENFREMLERGFLIRTDRGLRIAMDFQGNTVHFDATHPAARDYIWRKCKENYYDKGIRIFWLDEAEPEYAVYDFDNYRYHLGPNLQVGNIYPLMYAQAFYEGMTEEGQRNVINLLRCAWAGSQRFGALVWSGDIRSSFASLRNQVTAGLNMGMAGIPWWTTDIGGFQGGDPDDPAFRELLVRWFAWGAFCPVMRLHGDREPKKPQQGTSGGATCLSGADNEVWSFGDEAYVICKKFLFLREKLRSYISLQMESAHRRGTPVMRPLFYDFPEDKEAWNCEDAYMFGPDLLVAPVMEAKTFTRTVYLPAGIDWIHVWSGEVMVGGQTVEVAAPLDEIPVFCRSDVAWDVPAVFG
jgi:alpha-D-xyloside xylohydrolase